MEIKIYCHNCKVEILRADTDTLKTPLVGHMFKVKKDMEWSLFSPSDTSFDLTCPMCEWSFHDNGKVRVAVGDDFVFGVPEVIIPGIVAYIDPEKQKDIPTPPIEPESVVEEVVAPSCPALEAMQAEENPEIPPEIAAIQDIVEGTPKKEPETDEKPQINRGDWSEPSNIDEGLDNEAPIKTDPKKRGGRPKGSKNRGAKYRKNRQ